VAESEYPRAPDLQALVERFGGYAKIPAEAWKEYDAAMAQWHIDRRIHTSGHIVEVIKALAKLKRRKA
jgi:hypothetical protein